jgi:hypothetical protein
VLHLVRRPGVRVVESLIRVGHYDADRDGYDTVPVGGQARDRAAEPSAAR